MQSTQVIPFDFEKHPVRATIIDNDPWFVATDLCKVLNLTNTSKALQALDDDERSNFKLGRQGEVNIINESGLFTLILRSRDATKAGTPQHRFRKWVTGEVLPAIRKHGRYEDAHNRMGTLVGETIGTDGFHMLGALIKGKVAPLPRETRRRATMKIWAQTHAAFGVRCAADIPADQLDSARNFVAAYSLEGEWLPRQEPGGTLLDDHQLYDVYFVCQHFKHLYDIFKRYDLYTHLTALGCRAGIEMIDHFKDGYLGGVRKLQALAPAFEAVRRRLRLNQYSSIQ